MSLISILLILFSLSLFSIIFMLGRKLRLIRNGQVVEVEHSHIFVPDLQKIKLLSLEKIKRYEHQVLVAIVRFSIQSSNFLKSNYQIAKIRIKDIINKDKDRLNRFEKQEVNKFLKMISDYKDRIRHIKHKIKEEEIK